jgi:hypothetical protein
VNIQFLGLLLPGAADRPGILNPMEIQKRAGNLHIGCQIPAQQRQVIIPEESFAKRTARLIFSRAK